MTSEINKGHIELVATIFSLTKNSGEFTVGDLVETIEEGEVPRPVSLKLRTTHGLGRYLDEIVLGEMVANRTLVEDGDVYSLAPEGYNSV